MTLRLRPMLVGAIATAVLAAGVTALAATASAPTTRHRCHTRHWYRTHPHARRPHRVCRRRHRPATTTTPTTPAPATGTPGLVGTFTLTAGATAGAAPTGSYFRMVFPGGSVASGPFFNNPDSTASDHSYTLLRPGTDGGLSTKSYQEPPSPAFDGGGNALAGRIIAPQRFAGVNFSISTAAKDVQTGTAVPLPVIAVTDGKLAGQVRAFTAEWNRQWFNQGSPKPDGGTPGQTSALHGTYDATTRAFVLLWTSSIVGGPFNGFTGVWHLQGVFQPAAR